MIKKINIDNSEIQFASYHGLHVEVSFPQLSAISNHVSNLDVNDKGKIKKVEKDPSLDYFSRHQFFIFYFFVRKA